MKKGNLTREQAIAAVGEKAVHAVEAEGCEPTGRVGYNGACRGDDLCEWSASVECKDKDGWDVVITAYYYTDNDDDKIMAENDGDGSCVDWDIAGFEVA